MELMDAAYKRTLESLVEDPDSLIDMDNAAVMCHEILAAFGANQTRPQQVAAVIAVIEKRMDGWVKCTAEKIEQEEAIERFDREFRLSVGRGAYE